MLPRENRLKTSQQFDRAYKKGAHVKGRFGKLVAYSRGDEDPTRIGIVVSAKQGNAVERNRAKRVVREAFMSHLPDLKRGCDISYILWDISFDFNEMVKDLETLMKKEGLI